MIFNVEMETMPIEEKKMLQLERLKKTLRWAYDRVPFHREQFDRRGVRPDNLHSLDDLKRFPFMKKSDLRDNYPFGLLAVNPQEAARVHASSGTKGKPTIVAYTRQDIENWAEIVARAIAAAGGSPGDLFHNAYGYGLFTGGLGLHYGIERFGAVAIPISGGNTQRQIMFLQDLKPQGISGTPSYILNIIETMQEMGIDSRGIGLKYGIFGAEPWTEEMRKHIESALGLKAVDIYGLSEVLGPGVGIECHDGQNGLHLADDHFLAEVIDPNTGEVLPYGEEGELVFTSLTKEAFPVIRYRTGDIASLHPEPCPYCGRTTMRMSRVKGRIDDMLIIRGVNVFPSEVETELLKYEELAPHYQIVIEKEHSLDRFEVHVELTRQAIAQINEEVFKSQLSKHLKEVLGISVIMVVHPPQSIPRSEGKVIRIIDNRQKEKQNV